MLIEYGMITNDQLIKALRRQKRNGGRLGRNLIELGYIKEDQLVQILSKIYDVPALSLSQFTIEPEVLNLIPRDLIEKYQVFPVDFLKETLTVAMVDPSNVKAVDDLAFHTGYKISAIVVPESSFTRTWEEIFNTGGKITVTNTGQVDLEELEEKGDAALVDEDGESQVAPIGDEEDKYDRELASRHHGINAAAFVAQIIQKALHERASDIHFEFFEDEFRIRFRIDGVLHRMGDIPEKVKNTLVSRIKIMAKLDISETRMPQDGHMKVKFRNRVIDFRVSILPTMFGEKVVLRILESGALSMNLKDLGFDQGPLEVFKENVKRPEGLFLITGPSGCGKTTTLYSVLAQLNSEDRNIVTCEDPIELNIEGINQTQVNRKVGYDFAGAFRSFLRQNANMIMIGEIRDKETGMEAIRSALAGYYVMITIHTNDAPGALTRRVNVGLPPYLVGASVKLVASQMLLRKLCERCKEPVEIEEKVLIDSGMDPLDIPGARLFRPVGCPACKRTGYYGRIGLFEVLIVDNDIRQAVLENLPTEVIRSKARLHGMATLRESGLVKMRAGITSLEEVLRVTYKDPELAADVAVDV